MKVNRLNLFIITSFLLFSNMSWAQYKEAEWKTRDQWMNVSEIFKMVGVKVGSVVADIGCHEGYLTIHSAKTIGSTGKVYAVDVRQDRLDQLNEHLEERKLKNVTTVLGAYDDPKLPNGMLDVVLIVDTYHEMEDYMTILKKVKTALKPNGKILILEKLKKHMRNKSREEQMDAHTLESRYVKEELKKAGFTIVNEVKNFGKWKNEDDKTMWIVVAENTDL